MPLISNIRSIGVFGSHFQNTHTEYISILLNSLSDAGLDVSVKSDFSEYLSKCGISNPKWIQTDYPTEDMDVLLSIGGDGTFLRAAEWVGRRQIPILGVNSGHLGFLANYSPKEAPGIIADILQGNLEIESRMLLEVKGDDIPADFWPYALNEVALLKEDSSSMIQIYTEIDSLFLTNFQADGLLISTPTGSTGYNLSVGGPILQPTLGCCVLSPVAPHSLTMRPLAVSSDSRILTRTFSRAGHFRLSLDGRSFILESGSEICVTKADFELPVLRRKGADFASTLRHKLGWGIY